MENTKLSDLGCREIGILSNLLNQYLDNPNILWDWVKYGFNKYSWNVYLYDEDYNVAMLNWQDLERFYSLPYWGWEYEEGFKDDFMDTNVESYHIEDLEYIYNTIIDNNYNDEELQAIQEKGWKIKDYID